MAANTRTEVFRLMIPNGKNGEKEGGQGSGGAGQGGTEEDEQNGE